MNIRLLAISAAIMVVSFMILNSSHAETVKTSADLQNNKKTDAYVHSRPMFESMYRLGVAQDRKFGLQVDCKSKFMIKPHSTVVLSPIEFPDDKQHPTKGVWKFRYQLERCGESKFYNALFFANSSGEAPTPKAYYPGLTNASAVLVRDAMPTAVSIGMARSGLKNCKDVDVFDMYVTEPVHDVVQEDKTLTRVWNETWTFRACGQMIDVGMTFVHNAKSGSTDFFTSPTKVGNATVKP